MAAKAAFMNQTVQTAEDERRWRIVEGRHTGDFFLGVKTTGIFCRPGCAARMPLRRNVRFFDDVQGAVTAGFRPCLKCKPLGDDPALSGAIAAARAIEAAPEARWTNAEIGAASGASARAAVAKFRAVLGLSPKAFRDAVRLRRYQQGLREGETATAAGLDAGYGSEAARHDGTRRLAMSTKAYARGGRGEVISWYETETRLGPIVLAATEKGLCLLQFLDGRGGEERVRESFPNAEIAPAAKDAGLRSWAAEVVAFVEGDAPRPDLPTDLRGTAFQAKVWQALLDISPGQTPTYGDIATRVGAPKAFRAVGNANGKNPVAIVVPCHLVVASGGKLGGYAGGSERKKALLALERAQHRD